MTARFQRLRVAEVRRVTADSVVVTLDVPAPFSDFALHQMGRGLADGISQGNAAGDEFRTAPLWGVGQRIFFLHDGRTNDLLQAITAHASQGSEANTVIANFGMLSASDKQALLNYLRSL